MKNFLKLKAIRRIVGIIAIAAVIGFSFALTFTSCDNNTTGAGYYAGGGLSGTYHYDNEWYITLNGNGTFYGRSYRTVSGSYTVQGSTLRLSTNFFGSNWTIVNANTLRDGDGDYWRK